MNRINLAQYALAGMVAALLLGCGNAASVTAPEGANAEAPLSHALIYVVHGDGDYRYHNDGEARRADVDAVSEARLVARNAPGTEVFIFHQRPKRSLLGLIQRRAGTFYHYRNGSLVEESTYRRDPTGHGLSSEAAIYRIRQHPDIAGRTFLYYGHELAEEEGARYHASYPDHVFGINELSEGLKSFGAESSPFELVVLSTCNNGSPGSVAALAPFTRRVLASPGNLHLSFIDSQPLHRVATSGENLDTLAVELGRWAYSRLAARTQTAVTLALYETNTVKPMLERLEPAYAEARSRLRGDLAAALSFADCRDVLPEAEFSASGVQEWYRPSSFGRQSRKKTHSGWGCPVPRDR